MLLKLVLMFICSISHCHNLYTRWCYDNFGFWIFFLVRKLKICSTLLELIKCFLQFLVFALLLYILFNLCDIWCCIGAFYIYVDAKVMALYKFIYTPSLIIMHGDRRKFFFAVSLEILDKFLAICFFTYQCPEYFVKCFWPFPSSCGH